MNYDEKIELAAKMWADGCIANQIAKKMGVTDGRIRQLMREHRDKFPLKENHNTDRWTAKEDKILMGFVSPGLLQSKIIKFANDSGELNRTPSSISNRLTFLNGKKREASKRNVLVNTGCHMKGCTEPSIGRFCEAHAREGFPRDMGTHDLLSTTSRVATNIRKSKVTMPKLRVLA